MILMLELFFIGVLSPPPPHVLEIYEDLKKHCLNLCLFCTMFKFDDVLGASEILDTWMSDKAVWEADPPVILSYV